MSQEHRRKRRIQRLIGVAFLLISALAVVMAATGSTPETQDCTAVLITAPLGVACLVSKQIFI